MLEQGLGTLKGQIDKQANVFQGNPSAMGKEQQKHKDSINKGITPDLLKALAMQKVASETAAAENQLKLSMEQNSATVVEQLEQNAMARTQDDLVKQTAGILNERNKKRKQQMSPSKPPQQAQQRPPMQMAKGAPQGAPQGLPAAPRPPMRMANGGIIGYNKGDKVEAKKGSRLEEALKSLGLTVKEYMALPPLEKTAMEQYIQKEYVKQRKEYKAPSFADSRLGKHISGIKQKDAAAKQSAEDKVKERLGISVEEPVTPTATGIAGQQGKPPVTPTDTGIAGQQGKPPVPTTAPRTIPDMGGAGVLAPKAAQPPAGQPPAGPVSVDQQLQDVLNTPAPDTSGINKTQLTDTLGDSFMGKLEGRMDVDPVEERDKELARLASDDSEKGGFGVKKYEEGLAELRRQQKALDKELLDPETAAKKKRDAYWLGVRKGGGLGGAEAMANFDKDFDARRQTSLTRQRELYIDNQTKKNVVIKDINVEAAKALELYTDDVAAAMNTMANISKGDLELASKEADRMYNTNQNGIKNKIDAIRVSGEAKLRELVQKQASLNDIAKAIEGLVGKSNDLRKEHFKALQPEMMRLNTIIESSDPVKDADKIKAARAQITSMEATFGGLQDKTKIDELIKIYEDFLLQLKAQGGYTNQLKTSLEQKLQDTLGNTSATQASGTTGSNQSVSQKAQSYLGQAGQSAP